MMAMHLLQAVTFRELELLRPEKHPFVPVNRANRHEGASTASVCPPG